MDVLRHGAMDRLFTGVRAPSTLGTFLRAFTFGHVRQLDAAAARLLARWPHRRAGTVAARRRQVAYVDIDDTVRETHGYAKQGAGFGYSGVNGLNALLGVVSTPAAAPVIAAARLRKGSTNSARGAARLVSDTLKAAAAAGADPGSGSLVIVRMDSAFHGHDVIAAVRRAGAKFSVTARMNPAVTKAIAGTDEDAWTAIHYPNAFVDPDTGDLISDAEVAEVPVFTSFTSRRKNEHVTARLIVRRVKRLNPTPPATGCRPVKKSCSRPSTSGATTRSSPTPRRRCWPPRRPPRPRHRRAAHRRPQERAPAHLPSGVFTANAAWLALAAIAFNLCAPPARSPRRVLVTAGRRHHRHPASPARLRPGRVARSARRLTLRLPTRWPWHEHWTRLADHVMHPARSAAPPISGLNPSTARPGPEQEPDVEDPDRPGDHSRLHHQARPTRLRTINETLRRWIRAEGPGDLGHGHGAAPPDKLPAREALGRVKRRRPPLLDAPGP